MTTRRHFLRMSTAVGTGTLILAGESLQGIPRVFGSVQVPQTPLPGASIPQFVESLPTFVGNRVSAISITARVQEFQQQILPEDFYKTLEPPFDKGTYLRGYKVDDKPAFSPGF